jgi:Family of unknown function (DUF6064)
MSGLPFTVEQFFDAFALHNLATWPVQIAAYALAVAVLWAVATDKMWARRAAMLLLAAMWLWNGVIYHAIFFSGINPAAYAFGIMFVSQGLLYLLIAAQSQHMERVARGRMRDLLASAMIAYAMLVYPAVGLALGHVWPRTPMFGVAPCPTVIFTFGITLLMKPIFPYYSLLVPLVWAGIGSTAAVLFGVWEDLGLIVSAIATLLVWRAPEREVV